MTTLKDFLGLEADKWNAEARKRETTRNEWLDAVRRLLDQIQQWLKEADSRGVLEKIPTTVEIGELELGYYQAPSLTIRLGGREVRIEPVAYRALGPLRASEKAEGMLRVTDGASRYDLYRYVRPNGEEWLTVDDKDYSATPFSRARFEEMLVRLFK